MGIVTSRSTEPAQNANRAIMDKQDYLRQVDTARQGVSEGQTPETLRSLAKALHSLARYLANHERSYAEAVGTYEEAASIFRALPDAQSEARAYFDLGLAYELGFEDYELAARYVRKAMDLAPDEKSRLYYEQELDCLQVNRLKKGSLH